MYISRLYKKFKIKHKLVRKAKVPCTTDPEHLAILYRTCRDQVKQAIKDGLDIVYSDETVFTKRTYKTRDWGHKH